MEQVRSQEGGEGKETKGKGGQDLRSREEASGTWSLFLWI